MIKERRAKINLPIVLRLIGWLLLIEAAFMLFPFITDIITHDDSLKGFFMSIIITVVAGMCMAFGIKPRYSDLATREAILLTSLVWLIFSLFGMLPFVFSLPDIRIIDAYFEAVSGFTTTGASIFIDVESLPHGLLLWRSLMQWVGGMGIILFTLAVLPMLNHKGGIQLFNAEVSGITHDKLRPRISQTAKGLWLVYIIISIAEFVLLLLGPMETFDALCQTLSTVSTGGFSTKNASIGWWDSTYISYVVLLFMFLGSVNIQLLYRFGHGDFKALYKNDIFKCYIAVILTSSALIVFSLIISGKYDDLHQAFLCPLFHVVSGMSSTGFAISNYEQWGQFTIVLFIILMFFGACAGSTASGAKIDRLIVLIKNTRNEFYRIIHPNSITTVRVNNKVVPNEAVNKIIAFLAIFVMILAICTIILTLCGYSFIDSVFASVSALSNIGYGAGITGFDGSFFYVADVGKITLIFAMIAGRLELFTFLVIFTKYFWVK